MLIFSVHYFTLHSFLSNFATCSRISIILKKKSNATQVNRNIELNQVCTYYLELSTSSAKFGLDKCIWLLSNERNFSFFFSTCVSISCLHHMVLKLLTARYVVVSAALRCFHLKRKEDYLFPMQ